MVQIIGCSSWVATSSCFETSLCVGLVLSILGTSLLFLGQIITFVCRFISLRYTLHDLLILAPAVLYTVGIIVSLIGTGFLIGVCYHNTHVFASLTTFDPVCLATQAGTLFISLAMDFHVYLLSQMFKPVRIVATIVLIVSMGLVFVGAFVLGNAVSILIPPVKEDVLGLTSFPAGVYKYVPVLLVGLPHILIPPIVVFVIVEYLAYTW